MDVFYISALIQIIAIIPLIVYAYTVNSFIKF